MDKKDISIGTSKLIMGDSQAAESSLDKKK
jgi:hypothetical protein